jgi:hypothetical protein
MGDHDDSELKPGTRIQLSALGRARSPRMKVHTGVVVGKTYGSEGVRIIMDGSKTPITLHESYIEPQLMTDIMRAKGRSASYRLRLSAGRSEQQDEGGNENNNRQ